LLPILSRVTTPQSLRALCVVVVLLAGHISEHVPRIVAVLTAALRATQSTTIKLQVRAFLDARLPLPAPARAGAL